MPFAGNSEVGRNDMNDNIEARMYDSSFVSEDIYSSTMYRSLMFRSYDLCSTSPSQFTCLPVTSSSEKSPSGYYSYKGSDGFSSRHSESSTPQSSQELVRSERSNEQTSGYSGQLVMDYLFKQGSRNVLPEKMVN